MTFVIFHDLECGGYSADLALWLELAQRYGSPILDVGAGTGRVTLTLARAGHDVVAVDYDADLIGALRDRARGLPVDAVQADARTLALGRRFALCIVPMQTVQLLGGATERGRFLRAARDHLLPGGVLAIAIITEVEEFEWRDGDPMPLPDVVEIDGTVYSSQPTAVLVRGSEVQLDRRLHTVRPNGSEHVGNTTTLLHTVSVSDLCAEGIATGFEPAGTRQIAATDDHVGSTVVLLRLGSTEKRDDA